MIPLEEVLRLVTFMETRSRMVVVRRRGNGALVFERYRVSVLQDDKSSVGGWS